MSTRLKLITVFVIVFVVMFALLNSLFIVENVKYWFSGKPAQEGLTQTHIFPISKNRLTAGAVAGASTGTNQAPDVRVVQQGANARLVIDKIGVNAPIVYGTSVDTKVIYKELEKGVINYFNTPKPGENGVSVIIGHSSAYPWYKGSYGSVFALLGRLKPGDSFYVQYVDGRRFNYVVKQSLVFKPLVNDLRLSTIEKTTEPTLVLISCWPIGTNYQRIAIEAKLAQSQSYSTLIR